MTQLDLSAIKARAEGAVRALALLLNQSEDSVWRPAQKGVFALADTIVLIAEVECLRDKVEGLESDISDAVETAYRRGAVDWAVLNYPDIVARLSTTRRQ